MLQGDCSTSMMHKILNCGFAVPPQISSGLQKYWSELFCCSRMLPLYVIVDSNRKRNISYWSFCNRTVAVQLDFLMDAGNVLVARKELDFLSFKFQLIVSCYIKYIRCLYQRSASMTLTSQRWILLGLVKWTITRLISFRTSEVFVKDMLRHVFKCPDTWTLCYGW